MGIGNFSVGLPVQFFEPGQFKEGAFVGPSQGGVSLSRGLPAAKVIKEAQQAAKK